MHLERLPSGRWRAIVQVGGRRRSTKPAETRAEANRLGARLLLNEGGDVDVGDITVAELLDQHLANQRLAPRSLENYEAVRRRLLPAPFEARRVPTVTPLVIDALYRGLDDAGTSPHQVRKLHSLLSGAFSRARRMGMISVHPCRDALVPAEPEPNVRTPDTDEARALLAASDEISPTFGLYCRVAAQSGARPGEVVALQRQDVTITRDDEAIAGELSIVRGVSRAKGQLIVGPLKTGICGRRRVAIGPALTARLEDHLLHLELEHLDLGGQLTSEDWLFSEDGRRPWYPTTPGHWWARARDAAGIGDVRLYDLRHYVATELYAGGFDEQTAMRRLGHTNPVTTGRRYATSRPARDRRAAEYRGRGDRDLDAEGATREVVVDDVARRVLALRVAVLEAVVALAGVRPRLDVLPNAVQP